MTDRPAIIQATHLDKFYGDFHALKDIDLTVHQGEKVVVCGPSGSGKSTPISPGARASAVEMRPASRHLWRWLL